MILYLVWEDPPMCVQWEVLLDLAVVLILNLTPLLTGTKDTVDSGLCHGQAS